MTSAMDSVRVAARILLLLFASSSAEQAWSQSGDFSIRIGDLVGINGGTSELSVILVSPAEDISSVQLDLCDDELVDIDFSGVAAGSGLEPRLIEDLEISFGENAWSASVMLSTGNVLAALVDHELFVAEYDLLEVGIGTVEACGSLLPALLTTATGGDVEPFVEPGDVFIDEAIPFLRGDINGDGRVEALLDAAYLLTWAFAGGASPPCMDAADSNNNGTISALSDGIYVLNWQFSGGNEPALPGTESCGPDPESGNDNCATSPEPCPSEVPDLDPDASVAIRFVPPASVVELDAEYVLGFRVEIEGDPVNGFQFGMCHDGGLDIPIDSDSFEPAHEEDVIEFGFAGFEVVAGGWTAGMLASLTMTNPIEAGEYDLLRATYTALEEGEWTIGFCDTLGDPPIAIRALRDLELIRPEVDDPITVTVVGEIVGAFLRGDVDGNGSVSALQDALALLDYAFTRGPTPPCLDAADVDDSGEVSGIPDSIYLLRYGFLGGDPPPAPGPTLCNLDPTADETTCTSPPASCQ